MTAQPPPEHKDAKDPAPELGLVPQGRRAHWRLAMAVVAVVLLLLYLLLR